MATGYTEAQFAGGVVRDDGACIPNDPGNRDWQEYQAWCAAGNVRSPYVPPPPPPPPPALTGASLLDVLSDAEAAATGVKPRDLLRLAARGTDVVPATNPKLARILAKTPSLTYEALLARLPGPA